MSFCSQLVNKKCIEKYAGWVPSEPCDCPVRFWGTVDVAWQEVPMWHPISERGARLAIGCCSAANPEMAAALDPVHETVNVTYECAHCKERFHRTYELVSNNNGTKQKLEGHYENVYKTKERSNVRRQFDFVEERYFEMGHAYNLSTYNCKHWAREFFGKITKEQQG